MSLQWYKWYPGDYLRDTIGLTSIEDCMYRRSLDYYYSTGGPLPADPKTLHKILRAYLPIERKSVQKILEFYVFAEHINGYIHKRADAEILKNSELHAKQSEKAKNAAAARWSNPCSKHSNKHTSGDAPSIAPQKQIQNKNKPKIKTLVDFAIDESVFNDLWKQYPRREGRAEALRHFRASVKTEKDLQDIKTALKHYLDYLLNEKIEQRFIKHGSTWFNNWRDWIEVPISLLPETKSGGLPVLN